MDSPQTLEKNATTTASPVPDFPSTSRQIHKTIKQKTLIDYAPLDSKSSEKCTASVVKFLATSMQPFSLVEEESFKKMIKTLNPRYTLPSRKYFSGIAIPKLYNDAVEQLKAKIQGHANNSSITCDCWTSIAGQPYVGITLHFIDESWELISVCLCCFLFEENHTAEKLHDIIDAKLVEWKLDPASIVSCTTDNGRNIVNAVKSSKMLHVPCFPHTINIGINRALEIAQIKSAVTRLKCLQNSIAHSWKMKRDLAEAQELLKCEKKSLPSACPTRWWSTTKLCQRFLGNQLPICKMLQNFPEKKHLMPEKSEISSLESLVEVTSTLENITDILASENYVTSSVILPVIQQIKKKLKVISSDSQLDQLIKERICGAFSKYEEGDEALLIKCTFVDPRFKNTFMSDTTKSKVRELIKTEIIQMYNSPSNQHENFEPPKKKKKGLSLLFEQEDTIISKDPRDIVQDEIEKYLYIPKLGMDDNPLKWWKENQGSFPNLVKLAKKYLAVQGSSVPCERVFSTGGNVISKRRCSLLPKNAEMQIFLHCNKKILNL